MVWVQRDQANAITGVYINRQPGIADEQLADNAPEVVAFRAPKPLPNPVDVWDVVSARVAFNHENRIRALEGKAAITLSQFITAVKALP